MQMHYMEFMGHGVPLETEMAYEIGDTVAFDRKWLKRTFRVRSHGKLFGTVVWSDHSKVDVLWDDAESDGDVMTSPIEVLRLVCKPSRARKEVA